MSSMQITMFLNIGSIALGIGAWGLACLAIVSKKATLSRCLSVASFSVCLISLVFQLLELRNRVNVRDFSAIEDTIGAVIFAAIILVTVTIILNVAALCRAKK